LVRTGHFGFGLTPENTTLDYTIRLVAEYKNPLQHGWLASTINYITMAAKMIYHKIVYKKCGRLYSSIKVV